MKQTVLGMTQDILSSLSSDEVNSIGDTAESMQVASILKQTYNNIVARGDFGEHNLLFQLVPSISGDNPVVMQKPDNITKIYWVKYYNPDDGAFSDIPEHGVDTDIVDTDNQPGTVIPQFYEYVTILPQEQFLDFISTFNPDDDDIVSYVFQGFNMRMKIDKKPQFCTVIQDLYVLFDSYQSQIDDTLQASKTMCKGQLLPTFTLQDNFIPNLDDKQFPLLVSEAKALAYFELRQMPHQKAEQESKRQWAVAQKNRSVFNNPSYFEALPDYGRRSWGASWSPYVWKSSRRYDTSAGS